MKRVVQATEVVSVVAFAIGVVRLTSRIGLPRKEVSKSQ